MTPIAVSGRLYAAASIVPTVSLASARTCRSMPRARSSFCSRPTTSSPTTPDAANSLFHTMSRPESRASCVVGKEKVKPITPEGAAPPHSVARKVATESARKPKSPSAEPFFVASDTLNLACLIGPTTPSPRSVSLSTRKLVPPKSSAKKSPRSWPVTRCVTYAGSMRIDDGSPASPLAVSARKWSCSARIEAAGKS